ncbi:MAG: CpaE family protein, partial [bacterium]
LISTNLSCVFRRLTQKRIALVDFDLQFGDDAILMDMTPTNTIASLARDCKEEDSVDWDLLELYMHTHEPSAVDVLAAPPRPEEADYVTDREARKILAGLKRHYDYVIVDTSSQVTESVIASLENSDIILLLLTLELPTIKNGKLMLELMDSLGIQLQEVEEALEREIIEGVPSEGGIVMPSIDEGMPVALSHPDSEFTHKVSSIARQLIVDEFELEDELVEGDETVSADTVSPVDQPMAEMGSRLTAGLIDYGIGFVGFFFFFFTGIVLGIAIGSAVGWGLGIITMLLGLGVPLGYLTFMHAGGRQTFGEVPWKPLTHFYAVQ